MKTRSLLVLMLMTVVVGMQLFADEKDTRPPTEQQEKVMVLPEMLLPGTPVSVLLHYVSTDGCPDFKLVKDSVVGNKIYTSKIQITDSTRACTQVITPFKVVLPLGVLDAGTEIYFGGKLIRVIKFNECKPNRLGLVEVGKNSCEGKLLVRDISNPVSSVGQWFRLPASAEAAQLKPGDKVRFFALPLPRDTTKTDSCRVAGQVMCFELIVPVPAFTLSGVALAGTDTVVSGRVVLINKEKYRAVAMTNIVNGSYVFANIPKGEYTLQAIPERPLYRYFLPTFYKDKLRIKEADFFVLDADLKNIDVQLVQAKTRTGNGKVGGRVTYEKDDLRDSVATRKPSFAPAANAAYDVNVMLIDRLNQVIAWTTTNENGEYSFDGIATEGYRVVCETTSADAESDVVLTSSLTTATVNLVLKAPTETTAVDQQTAVSFNIHPTVVTDYLTVELKEASEVKFFTMLGQQVKQLHLEAGVHTLDVTSLPRGVMLIGVGSTTHKIFKR